MTDAGRSLQRASFLAELTALTQKYGTVLRGDWDYHLVANSLEEEEGEGSYRLLKDGSVKWVGRDEPEEDCSYRLGDVECDAHGPAKFWVGSLVSWVMGGRTWRGRVEGVGHNVSREDGGWEYQVRSSGRPTLVGIRKQSDLSEPALNEHAVAIRELLDEFFGSLGQEDKDG